MSNEKEEQIAAALTDIVDPGTTWVVRRIANEILVEPHEVSSQHRSGLSAALVARLDALNQRLSDCGGTASLVLLLGVVVMCVGIQLNWFSTLLGPYQVYVQSIWFYLAICGATFFLTGLVTTKWEANLYRRHRDSLFDLIQRDGTTPADVYLKIKDDDELSNLVARMKEDSAFLDTDWPNL